MQKLAKRPLLLMSGSLQGVNNKKTALQNLLFLRHAYFKVIRTLILEFISLI